MFARPSRLLRLASQAAPATSRSASTSAAAPVKRAYTPRSSTYARTAPAGRPATPSSSSAARAPAAATRKAAPPAAPAAKREEELSGEPPSPQPVLDCIPEEFEARTPATPSFARKAAPTAAPAAVEGVPAFPSASPAAPTSSLSSSPSAAPTAFASAASSTPAPAPSLAPQQTEIDWSVSYHGLSAAPFTAEQAQILMRPLEQQEIEIKPDGLLYLPEILYRRILNKAFGPGGWGMVPRGEMTVMKNMVTREWGLVAGGRLVSVARGEQTFFDPSGMPTATEGCKSNALMRCCKDLGIASELWDPVFIRAFKAQHCAEEWTEHVVSKKKQKRWRKKGNKFEYPYQASAMR